MEYIPKNNENLRGDIIRDGQIVHKDVLAVIVEGGRHSAVGQNGLYFDFFTTEVPSMKENDRCKFISSEGESTFQVDLIKKLPAELFQIRFVMSPPY
mgnify:CR=1 FL=1